MIAAAAVVVSAKRDWTSRLMQRLPFLYAASEKIEDSLASGRREPFTPLDPLLEGSWQAWRFVAVQFSISVFGRQTDNNLCRLSLTWLYRTPPCHLSSSGGKVMIHVRVCVVDSCHALLVSQPIQQFIAASAVCEYMYDM